LFRGSRISQSELDDLSKKAQLMSKHEQKGVTAVVHGCSTCAKSYSEPCPVDWELNADEACHAPHEYSGYCAQGLNFDGWSAESKIVAEMSCSLCWPCSDAPPLNDAAVVE
jgi:CPW-WPC domain-containing protein